MIESTIVVRILPMIGLLTIACDALDGSQIERDLASACAECRLVEASVGEGDAEFAYATVAFHDKGSRLVKEEWQYQRLSGKWALRRRMPVPK